MKSLLLKPWHWFKRRKTWAKISLISLGVIFTLLFFASSILKSYINSNGQELFGRDVHVSSIHINYLTFSVTLDDFLMYEENKRDTFVYLQNGYVNMNPWQLFNDEYAFTAMEFDHLSLQVIQYDSTYNFSDLISDEPEDPNAEPAKYILKNIKIKNSDVHFIDKTTENNYPLEHLNIDIPEISWNGKKSNFDLNFSLGKKGKVDLNVELDNLKNLYSLNLKTRYLDVAYAEAYLVDYFNIQNLSGFFHTDIKIEGSTIDATNIYAKGKTSFSEISLDDKKGNPLLVADSMGFDIDSINVRKDYYHLNKSFISNSTFYTTFGKTASNLDYVMEPLYPETDTSIAESAPKNEDDSGVPFHFGIDETVIKNATVDYMDHTLDRPFHMVLSKIDILAKNYSENSRNVPVDFSMNINNSGTLKGTSSLDMLNTDNLTLNATLRNLDLVALSPYSEYYIAAPITQGKFNYDLDVQMSASELINNNNIDIRELEFGKKIESDSAYKVPVKLALILLKDKDDNIQFEVPVTGNPADPDFKLLPIIGKTFVKFLTKAAGKPFNAIAGIVGTNPEKLEMMPFEYGQEELESKQTKTLDQIAEILEKKSELVFSFIQTTNIEEESIRIAVRDLKKKYNAAEWKTIRDKDEGFVAYLISKSGMPPETSVEDMAMKLSGSSSLSSKVHLSIQKRNEAVKQYLIGKNVPSTSFTVETIDFKNLPEQMKVPKFKIEVSAY